MRDKNIKNVAIIIDSLGGGGAERVMLDLAKGLVDNGHQAHYICLEKRIDHSISSDIPIHILFENQNLKEITKNGNRENSAKKLTELVKCLEKEYGVFDLFLSNLDPTNSVVSLCNFENVRYVLHNSMEEEIRRELKLGPIKYFKKRKLKKIMDSKNLVAVSRGVAEEAYSYGLIQPLSVETIYNPCDFKYISRLASNHEALLPSEPYLLHVGRVVKQKRHDVLFKALSLMPGQKLVCLCKDVAKARKLAKKFGVLDRVILPGFTNNPYVWMKNAQLLMLSSDFEGLGMVLAEALSCGTPVVSTNCKYGPAEVLSGDRKSVV